MKTTYKLRVNGKLRPTRYQSKQEAEKAVQVENERQQRVNSFTEIQIAEIKPKRSRSQSEAENSLKSILSSAECFQSSSADIMAKFNALKERYNLTSMAWEFLRGYREAIIDQWYRNCFVFCYVWEGKPIVGNWDTMPEGAREMVRKSNNTPGGHYWKNKDGSIGKPFFMTEQ